MPDVSAPHTEFVRIKGWTGSDDLHHFYCCEDEDLALCGRDLSGDEDTGGPLAGEVVCVVCAELETTDTCPRFLTCREES